MSAFGYFLWLLGPLCQVAIMIFMVKRNLRAEFPFFFSYTLFQVIQFSVEYAVYHFSPDHYFDVYWTCSALGVMLGFMVIHEVFSYAIRPYAGLRDLGKVLFRWVSILLVLVACLMAISSTGMNSKYLVYAIVNVERAVRLMQVGMLLFIFLCSSYLGLTWRSFASGIAFGYGLFAASQLIVYSLRAQLGASWNNSLSTISGVVYNVSVIAWLGYAAMPEKVRQRMHNDVVYRPVFDRWNQAAMVLTAPMAPNEEAMLAGGHTYLTEIERAVDDIMAHSIPAENAAGD